MFSIKDNNNNNSNNIFIYPDRKTQMRKQDELVVTGDQE